MGTRSTPHAGHATTDERWANANKTQRRQREPEAEGDGGSGSGSRGATQTALLAMAAAASTGEEGWEGTPPPWARLDPPRAQRSTADRLKGAHSEQ